MKFLVIGHSVEDHIISGDKEIIKPGGIYYSSLALTSVCHSLNSHVILSETQCSEESPELTRHPIIVKDSIYLCTSAEKENYHLFADVFNLCESDFIQYNGAIPKVLLTIHGEKERDERYKNICRPLDIPYERLHEFDGILINMITGFDIELEQLIKIRKNFSGLIYMDVHTLSRGIGHHGHRDFRQIENFRQWSECINIIQVNEYEIKTISAKTSDDDIALDILESGTSQLILTKGLLGAGVYYLQKGELNSIFKSASKVSSANKIGLGDVFGAVYFYNYIKSGNLFSSLENSVTASGLAAEQNGLSKLKKL
jgi:hypothetical protein